MKTREFEINKTTESNRVLINVTLLGVCFTLFTFLIALNSELLRDNIFITFQLVCAIPLLMTSLFARTNAIGRVEWKKLGFITFLLGYSFLLNVVGIFLISFVSLFSGIAFYSVNILLAFAYSITQIKFQPSKLKERFVKDLIFILILVFFGILPALKIY